MKKTKDKELKFTIKKWSMSDSINDGIRKRYQKLMEHFQFKKTKTN